MLKIPTKFNTTKFKPVFKFDRWPERRQRHYRRAEIVGQCGPAGRPSRWRYWGSASGSISDCRWKQPWGERCQSVANAKLLGGTRAGYQVHRIGGSRIAPAESSAEPSFDQPISDRPAGRTGAPSPRPTKDCPEDRKWFSNVLCEVSKKSVKWKCGWLWSISPDPIVLRDFSTGNSKFGKTLDLIPFRTFHDFKK